MKNRYNYLKAKYAVWLKLKNKTGNLYNLVTNSFNMTNEEWEAEAKLNKYVDKLRNAPLPCPNLCTQLFDGVTSTGVHSWGPSSTLPNPNETFSTHNFEDTEMEETTPHPDTPSSTVPQPNSEESSGRTKSKRGKRNGPKETTLDDELKEAGKEIIKAAQAFTKTNNLDKEMDACMAKLTSLEWGEYDQKYTTALMLFSESVDNRKIWLRLNLSTCDSWVGWEDISHDSKVLKEVAFNPTSRFPFPLPDKYYLCDVAYTNTRGFMAPYRNTRYWLADFRRNKALNKEEWFNHAHAQLRNIIERTYGVLKHKRQHKGNMIIFFIQHNNSDKLSNNINSVRTQSTFLTQSASNPNSSNPINFFE
ncbi:uncharacterized protein LOC111914433 [Lactuca sativa]|uniref:uncharacterized protein LOC111914433 n=1 Tax=Lactuca sativa TaxID=4236 RepID=UPI000CD8156E|nr:uncharacterized protein LOC111914433 [Lactuca sativa]